MSEDSLVTPSQASGLSARPLREVLRLCDENPGHLEAIRVGVLAVDHAERALLLAVRQARAAGRTWEAIGCALGVSTSGAHQRFSKIT